jgi:exosome complex component RRP43
VTLPKATFDEETGRTTCSRNIREALPLKRFPISYSFGIFDGQAPRFVIPGRHPTDWGTRSTVLADPTAFEEPLLDTSISIVLAEDGSLLSAGQLGIADKNKMATCIAAAKERHEVRGREIYSF